MDITIFGGLDVRHSIRVLADQRGFSVSSGRNTWSDGSVFVLQAYKAAFSAGILLHSEIQTTNILVSVHQSDQKLTCFLRDAQADIVFRLEVLKQA